MDRPGRRMFQTLIGTVKSGHVMAMSDAKNRFQTLIGTVKSRFRPWSPRFTSTRFKPS